MQVATIGLDLAKHVFQIHGIDAAEKVVVRKQLRRRSVNQFTGGTQIRHFVTAITTERATFAAAVERWPCAKITLRNGARIIEKTWPADD